MPISAARLEPVASNTALTSSMRSSSVGIATRSERPVPRLSKRIRRKESQPPKEPRGTRMLPVVFQMRDKPRHPEKVDRAIAKDLVGNVHLTTLDVPGPR